MIQTVVSLSENRERRASLQRAYGFVCTCRRCTVPELCRGFVVQHYATNSSANCDGIVYAHMTSPWCCSLCAYELSADEERACVQLEEKTLADVAESKSHDVDSILALSTQQARPSKSRKQQNKRQRRKHRAQTRFRLHFSHYALFWACDSLARVRSSSSSPVELRDASRLWKRTLDCLAHTLPQNHPQWMHQYEHLAQVLVACGLVTEAASAFRKAYECSVTTNSGQASTTRQLR